MTITTLQKVEPIPLQIGRQSYKCPRCGRLNEIVNQCRCDPNNLPTTVPIPAIAQPSIITESQARQALKRMDDFISRRQRSAVLELFRCEEKQFFFDKIVELAGVIERMPKTYEQEGLGNQAVAHLHYFAGDQANWYITEKDIGTPEEPGQHQAFGLADLFGDGGELGYISLVEALSCNAELDFHWKPKTIEEIRRKNRD